MRDPLLGPFAAFLCGILLAGMAPMRAGELAAGVIPLAGLLVLSWGLKLPHALRLARWGTFAAAGALVAALHAPAPPPRLDAEDGETLRVRGCVVEPPAFSPDRTRFVLELEPHARIRITLPLDNGAAVPTLAYGDQVEVDARVRKPHNYGNPGAFDSEEWLARRDIYWQGSASAGSEIRHTGTCGSAWRKSLYDLRGALLTRIDGLYGDSGWRRGMMRALLLGDSDALQKIWIEDFRRTGTYHAIVVSGTHISVLAGCFLLMARYAGSGQTAMLAATGLLAWLYALLCGGDPPVTRSAAGFCLFLLARFSYRPARLLNLLAAVAFGFLLLDPGQLREASFQLSFLAVAALGAFAAPLLEAGPATLAGAARNLSEASRDRRMQPLAAAFRVELRLLAETLHWVARIPLVGCTYTVSLAARAALFVFATFLTSAVIQVALALPMIAYFHRVSVSGLSANVVVTPLLTFAVPLGFFAAATGWRLPAAAAGCLLDWAQAAAAWHAAWEPKWRVPDPPVWLAALFLASLLLTALLLRRGRRLAWAPGAVAVALLVLMTAFPFAPDVDSAALEITAIDVGQGESLFLSLPGGRAMLVDGGGIPAIGHRAKPRMDIGEDVVSPYLWSRRLKRLDVVVMTHAHEDHAAGLVAIIENFHPAEVWTAPAPQGAAWEAIREAARRNGTVHREMRAGERRMVGEVSFTVLAAGESAARNDDSLVLAMRFRERTAMLTGDAGRAVEAALLERGATARVEVLKVGHHGSNGASSGEFLDAVRPEFAVISAGLANSYGLPGAGTVSALERRHAAILRTDRMGLVTLRTRGRTWQIEIPRREGGSSALLSPF